MPHIVVLEGMSKDIIDATDALSTIEANVALSKYNSGTTPSISTVNAAHDTLMDFLTDAKSDLAGNVATFKTACCLE